MLIILPVDAWRDVLDSLKLTQTLQLTSVFLLAHQALISTLIHLHKPAYLHVQMVTLLKTPPEDASNNVSTTW